MCILATRMVNKDEYISRVMRLSVRLFVRLNRL